ncbi:MAG: S41 family peptidase [Planctomycetes bacterium]|nr:S41 family peptidase [Planctomycetota bacterium]
MRLLFAVAVAALLAFPLVAQDTLQQKAEKLLTRIERRPQRAFDYGFTLRRMADAEGGDKLISLYEENLDHESEYVKLICARLVLVLGEPELAFETMGELLESEDSGIIEPVAMLLTDEGPDDEELLERLEMAWEDSEELSAGARVALAEAQFLCAQDTLALEQLREFSSGTNRALVNRATLVLSEIGEADSVAGRLAALASESSDVGRLARVNTAIVRINKAIADAKSGKIKRKDKLVEVAIREIKKNYVDGYFMFGDDQQDLNNENLLDNAARGMVGATDRYGQFMTKKEIDAMNEDSTGRYVGIGAHVAMGDDKIIYITQPIYSGPAYKAGLRTDDKLIAIIDAEGERIDLTKITLEEGVDLVRGPAGSMVTLFIKRRGVEKEIKLEIKRGTVALDTALEEMLPGKVGYVRLTRFGTNSAAEMAESLKNLRSQGMTTLILDLRGNGGGQLKAVLEIADMFLKKGTLISTAGGRFKPWHKRQIYRSHGGKFNDIPMVVMIDENSASGSEMLSGALRDRATLVGMATFGKGIGQSFFPVNGTEKSRWLKVTVFGYYMPSGASIDRYAGEGGVKPHIKALPNYLEPWEVYAIDKIEKSKKIEFYLDQNYRGAGKAKLMELASFDGLDSTQWPAFDDFYTNLDTKLAKNDVRRELRFALRRRVQDDRGGKYKQNYQEDIVLLRGIKEVMKKGGKDAQKISQYGKVMK